MENLDLDEEWDVLSVDQDEPDSDAICSLSEGEVGTARMITMELGDNPFESIYMATEETPTWRKDVHLPQPMRECTHEWVDNGQVLPGHERCRCCGELTNPRMRASCAKCQLTVCPMCSRFYLGRRILIQAHSLNPYDSKDTLIKELLGYVSYLLAENAKLKEQLMENMLVKDQRELEMEERWKLKGKGLAIDEEEEILPSRTRTGLVIKEVAKILTENAQSINIKNPESRKTLNGLYNFDVYFEIPGVERFKVHAILDTGASACCINIGAVPKEAVEPSMYSIQINGVNSQQTADQKLKNGQMSIEENKFRIPFTYAFPMEQKDGIQMLIGCNFIRAMQGGLRIEGQTVTFYKNVTTIKTSAEVERVSKASIEELDLGESEYMEIQDFVAYNIGEESIWFRQKFQGLINSLKEQGYNGPK